MTKPHRSSASGLPKHVAVAGNPYDDLSDEELDAMIVALKDQIDAARGGGTKH